VQAFFERNRFSMLFAVLSTWMGMANVTTSQDGVSLHAH